jgi:hypothetical protein
MRWSVLVYSCIMVGIVMVLGRSAVRPMRPCMLGICDASYKMATTYRCTFLLRSAKEKILNAGKAFKYMSNVHDGKTT